MNAWQLDHGMGIMKQKAGSKRLEDVLRRWGPESSGDGGSRSRIRKEACLVHIREVIRNVSFEALKVRQFNCKV